MTELPTPQPTTKHTDVEALERHVSKLHTKARRFGLLSLCAILAMLSIGGYGAYTWNRFRHDNMQILSAALSGADQTDSFTASGELVTKVLGSVRADVPTDMKTAYTASFGASSMQANLQSTATLAGEQSRQDSQLLRDNANNASYIKFTSAPDIARAVEKTDPQTGLLLLQRSAAYSVALKDRWVRLSDDAVSDGSVKSPVPTDTLQASRCFASAARLFNGDDQKALVGTVALDEGLIGKVSRGADETKNGREIYHYTAELTASELNRLTGMLRNNEQLKPFAACMQTVLSRQKNEKAVALQLEGWIDAADSRITKFSATYQDGSIRQQLSMALSPQKNDPSPPAFPQDSVDPTEITTEMRAQQPKIREEFLRQLKTHKDLMTLVNDIDAEENPNGL